ncbi:LysR family transcriptional regulator [Chitinilyticum piscinae]|uniref:LysR family transcriptional regulator n=1 Tax=Chitinilyticum piscinae TaxID=2866724 RepID=A0A8J7G145_9NEIS|nr:LysR family transcriptional regulator [Chitinilyticum piscinae]MBE9610040.1 LysR family transcriptional regulator [Chitinilyticum piscinae]
MALDWENLRLFLAVAETGSLSAAARKLRLGQPTLSRRMAELEESAGNPLFIRQTQGCVLTSTGEALLPAARRMAEWASEAESSLIPQPHRPSGKVRIAAPPGVAFEVLAPLAADIRTRYPELQLEILSGVATLNLARGEADISLRTRRPGDADLLCLAEVHCPVRVFVASQYAARLPAQPALADLDWITWAAPYEQLYSKQALEQAIPGLVPAFTSDDFNVQLAACRAGVGAMVLARALHRRSLLHELVELDLDLGPEAIGELYLVVHKRQQHLRRVQCVVEALRDEFARLEQTGSHVPSP